VVDAVRGGGRALAGAGVDLGGAAHAAEHASIGLLPLFATCDRWDIGGVSAARHPATGKLTVFVYDGHDGGAGFAERGFGAAADWLRATRQAIAAATARPAAPPACSRRNAGTATTRYPSGARSPCWTRCWRV
jgi:Distinct helicase family with a unique C-terminal domain including a metal-binding cysteine cluster